MKLNLGLLKTDNRIAKEDAAEHMDVLFGKAFTNSIKINTIKEHANALKNNGAFKNDVIEKTMSIVSAAMDTGELSTSTISMIKKHIDNIYQGYPTDVEEMTNITVTHNSLLDMHDEDISDELVQNYLEAKDSFVKAGKAIMSSYELYATDTRNKFMTKYKKHF